MIAPEQGPVSLPVVGWQRWFLPDLSLFLFAVTLLYSLIFFDAPSQLFRDSDTGWHIRNGESILREHRLPHTDPYSFSKAGQTWLPWEWASDVLMGWAHQTGGLRGVTLLYLTLIGWCSWFWVRLHWAAGGNFLLACLFAMPMLSTVNLHWLARPHVFSWLFLLGALLWLEKGPRNLRRRDALVVVVGTAAWTNFHASFPLAVLLPLLYGMGHALAPLIWTVDREKHFDQARWCFRVMPLALGATLLNPFGPAVHLHIVRYLGNTELLARIGEFQSFNFHSAGAWQIVLTMMLAIAGAVAALVCGRLGSFFVMVLFAAGALRSARGLPVLALVALPLANGAFTRLMAQIRDFQPGVSQGIQNSLAYFERLRLIDAQLRGWIVVPLILGLAFVVLHAPEVVRRTGFPATEFPVGAASEVEKLPPDARLLAPDKYGGYLIFRFAGTRKVYFDGRSDFYGVDFMKEYIRLAEVRPGWVQILENHGFTHALLPNEYSLIPALERLGWEKIFADKTSTLLKRNF